MLLRKAGYADALISIAGQREHLLEDMPVDHQLSLRFDDVPAVIAGDPLSEYRGRLPQRHDESIGLRRVPPSLSDAQAIVDFARGTREASLVICQCGAGISRSAAAALLCLAAWTPPGEEAYCVDMLLSVRPAAMPHRGLITFGEQVLKRDDALSRAMADRGS